PWTSTICIVVMLLSAITILAYAPLEDANKPLCVAEISAYKTRTRIIILLEILIIITAILVSLVTLSACLGLALLTNSISILLSEMKRSFVKKEEKET
ncbi:MAG: accessory gene regulator B family protein, partial [Clostridiales bacterium]